MIYPLVSEDCENKWTIKKITVQREVLLWVPAQYQISSNCTPFPNASGFLTAVFLTVRVFCQLSHEFVYLPALILSQVMAYQLLVWLLTLWALLMQCLKGSLYGRGADPFLGLLAIVVIQIRNNYKRHKSSGNFWLIVTRHNNTKAITFQTISWKMLLSAKLSFWLLYLNCW